MTDEQPILNEQPKENISYEDLNGKPRSTRRGSKPPRVEPEKEKKTGRAAKLTGKDIGEMFQIGSSTAVMLGAHTDWYISADETKPFQNELADLLNRIPARYAESFVNLSGYAVVAIGMYKVFDPRIKAERERRAITKRLNDTDQSAYAQAA